MNKYRVRACAAACAVLLSLASVSADAQQATAFQIDRAHSGATALQTPFTFPLRQLWQVTLSAAPSYALIADGRVYVLYAGPHSYGTRLVALDERTGKQLWMNTLNATHQWTGHAFGDGRVYAINFDGRLTAFDAATGAELWARQLPRQTEFDAPPTFSNGIVYVVGGGIGYTLYAVDAATGRLDWAQDFEATGGSPTLSDTAVYVAGACGAAYAMDPFSGAPIWTRSPKCDDGGGSTAVLSDGLGLLTLGQAWANLILDPATGNTLGRFSADLIPATKGTVSYQVSQGRLVARDHGAGVNLWRFGSRLTSAPIVVDDAVFVGDKRGNIYALDAGTGGILWQENLGAPIAEPGKLRAWHPVSGLAAGEGILVVPAGFTLTAFGD
jgi:outer membrane protein assembly factor BamB